MIRNGLICLILIFASAGVATAQAGMNQTLVPKFELKKSGLELERRTLTNLYNERPAALWMVYLVAKRC